jgi:hypothetical protein
MDGLSLAVRPTLPYEINNIQSNNWFNPTTFYPKIQIQVPFPDDWPCDLGKVS